MAAQFIGEGGITVSQIKDDVIMDESHFCMCCKELDICPINKGKLTFSRNLLVSPFVEMVIATKKRVYQALQW
jgi:hypothetical protein